LPIDPETAERSLFASIAGTPRWNRPSRRLLQVDSAIFEAPDEPRTPPVLMPKEPAQPSDPGDKEPGTPAPNAFGRYAGMGLSYALTILAFGWLGWWVDGKLGTIPVFLIAGVLVGFVGGLISMVKRVPKARERRHDATTDFDGESRDS
jgi:F0F1-type ATP synthase assembly protein I